MFQIIPRHVITRRVVPLTVRGTAPRLTPLYRQTPLRYYSDKKDSDKLNQEPKKQATDPSTTTTTTKQDDILSLRQKLHKTNTWHEADQLRKQIRKHGEEVTETPTTSATPVAPATSATTATPAIPATPATPATPAPATSATLAKPATPTTPTTPTTPPTPAQAVNPPAQPPIDLLLKQQLSLHLSRLIQESTDQTLQKLAPLTNPTTTPGIVNTLKRIERRAWAWRIFLLTAALAGTVVLIPEHEREYYIYRFNDACEEVKGWFDEEVREARRKKREEQELEQERGVIEALTRSDIKVEAYPSRDDQRLSILSKFLFVLFWCFCWSGGFTGLVLPGRVFRGGKVE